MIKIGKYLFCLLVVFCLFDIIVYADVNLSIDYVNKYDDVYDVDILINDNFRLDSSKIEVTLPEENFKIFDPCQLLDGSIESDETCQNNGKIIGYIHPDELTYSSSESMMQEIPGEIVLNFGDAATLKDGTYADVIMTINNIKIKKNREDVDLNKSVVILRQGPEYISNEANSVKAGYSVNYDIVFELRKNGVKVENLTLGIVFSDIDVYNKNHPNYSETIELLDGVIDNRVYRLNGSENYLCIDKNNTKFTSAKVCGLTTEERWNFTEKEEMFKGGFALKVKSDNFKYSWTGSGCGTDISFLTVNNPRPGNDDSEIEEVKPEPDIESPQTGNVSKVIFILILLVLSGGVMFIYFKKSYKFN